MDRTPPPTTLEIHRPDHICPSETTARASPTWILSTTSSSTASVRYRTSYPLLVCRRKKQHKGVGQGHRALVHHSLGNQEWAAGRPSMVNAMQGALEPTSWPKEHGSPGPPRRVRAWLRRGWRLQREWD